MVGGLGSFWSTQPRWFLFVVVLGFVTRAAVGIAFVPQVQTEWFVPFVTHFLGFPTLDPWQSFLDSGGDSESFPYGPVMLLVAAMGGLIALAAPEPWTVQVGIFVVLLLIEIAVCMLVARYAGRTWRVAVTLVLLSPLAVYATYVHGQLDIVPTALMLSSVVAMGRKRWALAGIFIGVAIAAKLSSVLLVPLVVVFLLRNQRYRSGLRPYILGAVPGLALAVLPVLLPGYRTMVLQTPTAQSIFAYALEIGPGLTVVVLPLVYAVILGYQYWQRRSNTDVLSATICSMLTAVVLLTPASPGWYLWSLPLLAIFASRIGGRAVFVLISFWSIATAALAVRASGAQYRWSVPRPGEGDFLEVGPFVHDLGALGPTLATGSILAGGAIIVMIFRSTHRLYDVYKLGRAPLSVAIAGDSGTGKDTISAALSGTFGDDSTAFLMGDDYHRYGRYSPIWQVTTHLHPLGNDLAALVRDGIRLMGGEAVVSRHYDHSRGTFTKRGLGKRGDVVVLNGLHMLTSPQIREAADLTVFLSMDEALRRRLKIDRDVRERGHSLANVIHSIERRYPDVNRFVLPQREVADMVLHLESFGSLPPEAEQSDRPLDLKLTIDVVDSYFIGNLHRLLISLSNILATLEYNSTPGRVKLSMHAEALEPEDVGSMARLLIENPSEVFVAEPIWLGGSRGAIQLAVVLALLERRKRKSR